MTNSNISVTAVQSPISDNLIYVDNETKTPWVNFAQLKMMFPNVPSTTMYRRLRLVPFSDHEMATIQTTNGSKLVPLYSHSVVSDLALEFDLPLAKLMLNAGAAVYLYGLAGYKIEVIEDVKQKAQSVRQLAPQRDLMDYGNLILNHPILKTDAILASLLSQRLAEHLTGTRQAMLTPEVPLNVTSIASNLGYSQAEIGTGMKLGKYVKARHEPLGKSQHGKYQVFVYLPSEVEETIKEYFNI